MTTMISAEFSTKVLGTHRHRLAEVYVRQSPASQVERHTESTDRHYVLRERAVGLGWPREAVRIFDADLGRSDASTTGRSGFAELTTMDGLGQGNRAGAGGYASGPEQLGLVSAVGSGGMTNTLLADGDGVYHPGLFNDRMLLGLTGTMSEAELQ